jgi:DNA-binding NarL/FixJ family response regulator
LARERFEPRSIDAFLRVVVHGQAVKSVAEDLGMTPNAVHVAKSKILTFLRQELDVEVD